MMGRALKIMAAALAALALSASCAVHEWPQTLPADATLKLDFNTALPQFIVLDVNDTRASKDGHDYQIRYVVEAYRKLGSGSFAETPYARYVFTKDDISELDNEVTLSIDEGTYDFYVWTDFVDRNAVEDFYYDTRNFREIKLQGTHEGNNDFRDAFVGHKELTVVRYGATVPPVSGTVEMERPLAKFEFITTDLQEFITKVITDMKKKEKENEEAGKTSDGQDNASLTGGDVPAAAGESFGESGVSGDADGSDDGTGGTKGDGDSKSPVVDLKKYNVVFYYTGYMPSSFNMFDNKPCDSRTGVSFASDITLIDEHNARLGFDYVMVNGKESSVMVAVGLFDEDGVRLSMSNPIEVPIKRSMLTTVKGSFLMQDTGGGVAIDPDFDGEFNIIIH